MWEPSQRYPDPAVQVLEASFNRYRLPLASVERLFTGCRWSEGPVYFGDGRYVLWSDIRGRRVIRTEYDGAITVLADSYQGKRLNSPNDVVVKSDGSIWFTDPTFGLLGYYEGEKNEPELPANVYRIDGQTGAVTVVADDVQGPNGLAFSPDESKLYVVESRGMPSRKLRVFEVNGSTLGASRMFLDAGPGTPDGFRVDIDGNLWCGWGMGESDLDGVRIFNAAAEPIGHIALPERCANLCFGGRWRNRLFMAASHGLYALYVNTQGAPGG
jgi:gluconolactonase